MREDDRSPGVPESRGRRNWRSEIRARLTPLRLAPEREAEIVEEVAQHLDDRFRELCAMGRTETDAATEAWRELEAADRLGRELATVERRAPLELPPPGATRRESILRTLFADIRYSIRALRKNPSFSIPVLLALALSIGPTTAVISLSNWLLWKPLAGVQQPDDLGLAYFGHWFAGGGVGSWGMSYSNVADLTAASKTIVGFAGVEESTSTLVVGDGVPVPVSTAAVNANFFGVIGMRLSAGRHFAPGEDVPPLGSPVAIISEGLAMSAFGGPAQAIGQRVTINRTSLEVVGVASPGFGGIYRLGRVQVWMTGAIAPVVTGGDPTRYTTRARGPFPMFVVRRASGVTWAGVEQELQLLTHQLGEAHPADNPRFLRTASGVVTPRVFPGLGGSALSRDMPNTTIRLLFAIAVVLVVLACANVANMLVFRAVRRDREVAVRRALGATRARLIQWQLTESWLLSISGAALGLLIALALKPVLQQLLFPAPAGVVVHVPLDLRVLGLTLGVAITTGLVAGLAPAWMAVRGQLASALSRAGTRGAARAPRLRSGLAIVQLALSLMLLIGAVLLLSTVRNLRSIDLGFEPKHLTELKIDLSGHGYSESAALTFWHDLHAAAVATGRFETVAVSSSAPFGGKSINRLVHPDQSRSEPLIVAGTSVSHSFFKTLSSSLAAGEEFTLSEAYARLPAGPTPVIINELLANQLFGTTNVVGRPLRDVPNGPAPGANLRIVGVSRDSNWDTVRGEREPFIYRPIGQLDARILRASLLVRSSLSSQEVTTAIREIAARFDGSLPVTAGEPTVARVESAISRPRLFAWTLSVLGGLGFLLAALGVYGLVAQTTAERSREFGIRVALGAGRANIAGLVIRFAATIATLGTFAGVGLAFFGSKALESMLFGITALNPAVYLTAIIMLAAVIGAACAIPAMRAMRVQPVDVLRTE